MSDADGNDIGYAGAVEAYWNLGWKPLPLPAKAKKSPPSIKCQRARFADHPAGCQDCVHYTGYGAVEPSWPDVMAWSEDFRDGNLCLRLPDGIVGIDVDAYGAKTGAAALIEATKRWGPLPASPRSSARAGDLTSGIRLFRVPKGTALETKINFNSLGIGDIEVIQPHHRYVVAWPSIHPEGGRYTWRDEYDTQVPLPIPDGLPELPARWIEGLKVVARAQIDGPIDFHLNEALTLGEPSIIVSERLRQAIFEIQTPGTSRHDTCTRHVMALARLGKTGEPGVAFAMKTLCGVLIGARAMDKSGSDEQTRLEFLRMLTNDNLARELSRPGVTDWVNALVLDNLQPENDSGTSAGERFEVPEAVTNADQPSGGTILVDDSAPKSPLEAIEQGFWQSRESIRMVWQTAMAQMASPWATLGICAARALTQVRPNVTLPPLIGGPGSLNFFVALVARSGGGKGAANAAANILIPRDTFTKRNLGSGEGLVKLFDRPKSDDTSSDSHEAILVNVDEVETLAAMNQRTASTTTSVLCSAFSGESLGFAYVNRAGLGDIPDHSYRMTLIVSVQPKRSGGLLSAEGAGLPQRFLWLPAKDVRIVDSTAWPSGPLTLPRPSEWMYPREVVIPDEARKFIRAERVKNQRDLDDALDGHAIFCREKFAFALAVMDGRAGMSLEDWELSGIAADVSTFSRELCAEQLKDAARIDALDRGEIRGIEMHASDEAKEYESAEKIRRVLRNALGKIEAAGEEGLSTGMLNKAIAHRDRRYVDPALQIAQSNGLIRLLEGTTNWIKI